MVKKSLLLSAAFILLDITVFAQGNNCQTADPFCTGNTEIYPAGVNSGTAQPGASYGCLYTQPNPAWYYMQIGTPGTIELTITSIPQHDIDFTCWGPFTSQTAPCVAQLTAGPLTPSHAQPGSSPYYPSLNMIDCSYSIYSSEFCFIPNGLTGEFYIMMITNYSNQQCDISFSQTGGTGTLNCNIVPYVVGDSVCVGQTIHLAVNIPTPGATYSWSGPNGWTSNLINPTIPNATPAMSGTYTVTITVNGQTGPPMSCNVYVGQWPSVGINASNTTICNGTPTTLTGTSTIPNTTYSWSNGSSGNPVNVTPSVNTTYTVTGTTQAGCSATSTVAINVNPSPVMTVTANPSTLCGGDTTLLVAAGADNYNWSNGLGTNDTAVAVPQTSTTYTVTGSFVSGCSSSATLFIQTTGPPVLINASPSSVCAGTGASVTMTAYYATSYVWSNGLGTGTTVVVTPSGTTTYTVTGTDNNGCTASAIRTIPVNQPVPVSVSISMVPTGTICPGTPVTFTATPTNGGTFPLYQWKKNGINTGTGPTITLSNLLNGDVIICILTSNMPCSIGSPATSNQLLISVSSNLVAGVSISANPPGVICEGTNVTFTATPVNGGIPTYQWTLNGSQLTGATGPVLSIDTLTNGNTVSCVMTSSLSCATNNPASSGIVMNVIPMPNTTINPAGPFCSDDPPVNLSAVVPGGIWFGSGITDSLLGTFSPAAAGFGSNSVHYVLSSGICTDTGSRAVLVYQTSVATIAPAGPFCVSDPQVTLISVSGGGVWSGTGIAGDSTLGIFDPQAAGAGNHVIQYSIGGPCPDTGFTTITVNAASSAAINPAGPFCITNAPVTLTAATSGGVWSGVGITDNLAGTFDPSIAGAGTHTITYMIGGSCSDTGTISIEVKTMPDASIIPSGPYCMNTLADTLTAVTPGGIWSGTGITSSTVGIFDPASAGAGTHQITYHLTNGACNDSSSILVAVIASANAAIDPAGPFCISDSIIVLNAADPGGTWSGTGITDSLAGTFDPAVAGTGAHAINYFIGGNCGDTGTINIIVYAVSDASINPAGPYCIGVQPVNLSAVTAGGTWSGAGITDTLTGTFDPALAGQGTHIITYILNGLCGSSDTSMIIVFPGMTLSGTASDESCTGENDGSIDLTVEGNVSSLTYTWSNNAVSEDLVSLPPGSYSVTVTDVNNCSSTVSFEIMASAEPCGTPVIYVPNIFTPNGDGQNDILYVRGRGVKELSFQVYDRWGATVHNSQLAEQFAGYLSAGWDGTYLSKEAEEGVYVWYFKATLKDGSVIENKGSVTLAR